MSAEELLKAIIADPTLAGINDRQAEKLYDRLKNVARDTNEAIRLAIDTGKYRRKNAGPTIYIANAGSSGSHWTQAMLSALAPMLPCGEVYFSKTLLERIAKLRRSERRVFMQAYHVIHGWDRDNPHLGAASAINTAHKANPMAMARHDHSARLVLLVRDPLEIVISRTFRKPRYRVTSGHADTSDADYMQVNIQLIRNFFTRINRKAFDTELRYESLIDEPMATLQQLTRALKLNIPDEKLANVAENYSTENSVKKQRLSNIYTGPKVSPPKELLEQAEADLADIREEFGYR